MVTAHDLFILLVLHFLGDYVLQSDWMAQNKAKRSAPAVAHAFVYGLCYLSVRPSPIAFAVISGSHFIIDRWRLARYVVWAKNFLAPVKYTRIRSREEAAAFVARYREGLQLNALTWIPGGVIEWSHWKFKECGSTGYVRSTPDFMAIWLLIIVDNLAHIVINYLSLRYL